MQQRNNLISNQQPTSQTNSLDTAVDMINNIRSNGNLRQTAMTMLQNNPRAQEVMSLIRAGRSPKDLALEMMQSNGINPVDVLSKLK